MTITTTTPTVAQAIRTFDGRIFDYDETGTDGIWYIDLDRVEQPTVDGGLISLGITIEAKVTEQQLVERDLDDVPITRLIVHQMDEFDFAELIDASNPFTMRVALAGFAAVRNGYRGA